MTKSTMLDVFGRRVLAIRDDAGWTIYYLGNEGKRRVAEDIFVPTSVGETEITRYLADQCHEWSSEQHSEVKRLHPRGSHE